MQNGKNKKILIIINNFGVGGGRHFSIKIRLPYFKIIKWQIKFSLFPIKHAFDGQHYWEIGKAGYGLNRVKNIILKSGFKIKKDYIAFEFPYHHFFVLEK